MSNFINKLQQHKEINILRKKYCTAKSTGTQRKSKSITIKFKRGWTHRFHSNERTKGIQRSSPGYISQMFIQSIFVRSFNKCSSLYSKMAFQPSAIFQPWLSNHVWKKTKCQSVFSQSSLARGDTILQSFNSVMSVYQVTEAPVTVV